MSEVITFTSGKGGVGKTTTTANVGVGLSLAEKKVLLIDTDIGLRNLDVVMGLENRIVYNLVDVLSGRCRVRQAIVRDRRYPNLSVIPSACIREKQPVSVTAMRHLLDDLRDSYDYILIDSPAGIGSGFDLAVCAADKAIVVTTPQIASIHDADCVLRLLHRQKSITPYILINMFRKDLVKSGEMLQINDIRDLLHTELIGVVIEDDNICISQNRGESMAGQKGVSAMCYANICRRILGDTIPIPDFLQEHRSFFHLLWNKKAEKELKP